MYRRDDDIIILYNLVTLIYLPIWIVLFAVYNNEFPPPPYLHHYTRHDRESFKLLVFFAVYLVEDFLGFRLKINRYIVIIFNLAAFYMLNRLAGYFFLEKKDMPVTYCLVFGLVTLITFLCVLIELNEKLKEYLLQLGSKEWIYPGFYGYKYETVCKKYWRGIFRIAVLGYIISIVHGFVKAFTT